MVHGRQGGRPGGYTLLLAKSGRSAARPLPLTTFSTSTEAP